MKSFTRVNLTDGTTEILEIFEEQLTLDVDDLLGILSQLQASALGYADCITYEEI